MRNIANKVISAVTAMTLGTAVLGAMPISADAPGASTPTRVLSVEYMGKGADLKETSPGKANLTTADVGDEFWVGVGVTNVHDLPLFTNGVYSLELAFEYDPDYVRPYFVSNSTDDANDEWAAELETGNLGSANSTVLWHEDRYEIISSIETDIDTISDREGTAAEIQSRKDNGWKMCTVAVTLKEDVAFDSVRFKDLSDGTKQYLLRLPFKLISAPTDGTSPTVLSLVRGPSTFDIGAGATGTDPFSAWEATVADPSDAENMKTLFTFAGDIKLFASDASVADIIPVKPKTGDETADTEYTMYRDIEQTLDGFNSEDLTYYLTVPNDASKLKLKIDASDEPEVYVNGSTDKTAVTSTGGVYETDEFDVAELVKNPDGTAAEQKGYNNTVTVTVNGTTYTIYIRRLLEPKIVLEPGNSPYGLIERMGVEYKGTADGWSDTKIAEAKQAFDDSHAVNKTYGNGYVPDGGQTELPYTTVAWDDIGVNYDMDPTAIFVYEAATFTDPGIKVYDAYGDEVAVNDSDLTKELKVRQISSGVPTYAASEGTDIYLSETSGKYDLAGKIIRPDKYEIIYTYNYVEDGVAKTLQLTRPTIILSKRGDIQLTTTPYVNVNDSTNMNKIWGQLKSRSALFAFRTADIQLTTTPYINVNDATKMASTWGSGYTQYYTILD